MRGIIAALVTAGLLITACGGNANDESDLSSDAAARASASIYGTVSDAKTGARLGGVLVSDGTRSTTSSSDGAYSLAERAGTYTVTVSMSGYASASQRVTVPRRGTVQVDFALSAVAAPPSDARYRVFANNDLGMHCVDGSFAVFSILPPYNVVDAQVVALQSSGDPVVLDATQVDVRYSATADATGSINSTSMNKSNFWQFVDQLYGASLPEGAGLEGMWMPADAGSDLAKRTLGWDAALGLFKAPGIPIFPIDDAGNVNPYPLMRFSAYDKAGTLLASTDVVLPVSDETSCRSCHATGAGDSEDQVRQRILDTHNAKLGTNLIAPVLCASCHYSPALDLQGNGPSSAQLQHETMSSVMHGFHASKVGRYDDKPVGSGAGFLAEPPLPAAQACYACHPGAKTQCLRGAMTSTLDCQNCHGNMAAVGGAVSKRTPWLDEPKCQSCHAGDAVTMTVSDQPVAADGIRFTLAFSPSDATATPRLATNKRFAENDGKLYRKSKGHGGLACEACHGSTHAIWTGNANDNVAATQLQGHAGTIAECGTCHLAAPPNGMGGPHGMHPIGGAWVSGHDNFAGANLAACQACHGTDNRGTVLSRTFAARTLAGRSFAAGTPIGCYDCHDGPNG